MSTVSDVSNATAASAAAQLSGGEELGQDTFLNLLTTQLQNQDPMNPQSSEEFVAQLATFSSLEQLMGIQSSLESVYMGIVSMNSASMASLLGSEVVAVGDTFNYSGEGAVDLHYDAASDCSSAELTVRDADGKVVYSEELGALSEGEGTLSWDGHDLSGAQLPEGEYTFTLTGTDSEGEDVSIQERVAGTITEMDYSTGSPQPSLDGISISVADIIRLTAGDSGEEG